MGMLCSARELGISEEHNGIWILPEDAPIGTDIREYARLDDSKIEIKLTPNRGDALSVTGCLLYTSDAADEEDSVDFGDRRSIKKKKKEEEKREGMQRSQYM